LIAQRAFLDRALDSSIRRIVRLHPSGHDLVIRKRHGTVAWARATAPARAPATESRPVLFIAKFSPSVDSAGAGALANQVRIDAAEGYVQDRRRLGRQGGR
jgi:hypothetical protein